MRALLLIIKKYKLIFMLSVITGSLIVILYTILINGASINLEVVLPLLVRGLSSNEQFMTLLNCILGRFKGAPDDPSWQVLLFLLIISYIGLIILIIASFYINYLMFIVVPLISYIFWNLLAMLKASYNIEIVAELFNKWGLIIRKRYLDHKIVMETIEKVYQTYIFNLKKNNLKINLNNDDLTDIKLQLLKNSYKNEEQVISDMNSILKDYMIISENNWGLWVFEDYDILSGNPELLWSFSDMALGVCVIAMGVGIIYYGPVAIGSAIGTLVKDIIKML